MANETDKVVDLAEFKVKRPEYVFECVCGSQHFYLNVDGSVECRSCKMICERIEWIYRDGQGPDVGKRA
jgi:hypothetical protein